MRKIAIILVFIMNLLPLRHSCAQSPAIDSGLGYLFSAQNPDRSWSAETGGAGTVASTVAVLETLKLLNQTDLYEYSGGVSWLQGQGLDATENLSERIHALTAGGADADRILAYLDKLINAWGGYDNYGVSIIDTVYAIRALKTINHPDAAVFATALNFLTNAQNTDGGWGFYKGDASNTYVTSLVLGALSMLKANYSGLQPSVDKAVAHLFTKQNPDGGFGSSPSAVHETALAYEALVTSGADVSASLPPAIGYLTRTQQANGLALHALADVRPNLSVSSSDIAFSDTNLTVGEQITITAVVKNTGMVAADKVMVNIYDGDPAQGAEPLLSRIIGALPAGGAATPSVPYIVSGNGAHSITVWADPRNQLAEVTRADNLASKSFWGATWPDLAVYSEDLKPSTYVPTTGTPFTLNYTVRNLGESATGAFDVAVYDGQPSGTPIQTAHISGLNGTETRTGTFGVTLTGDGSHTLYLVADAGAVIQEISEISNTDLVSS